MWQKYLVGAGVVAHVADERPLAAVHVLGVGVLEKLNLLFPAFDLNDLGSKLFQFFYQGLSV